MSEVPKPKEEPLAPERKNPGVIELLVRHPIRSAILALGITGFASAGHAADTPNDHPKEEQGVTVPADNRKNNYQGSEEGSQVQPKNLK